MDGARAAAWLSAWEGHILASARRRYCDTEMGEELGWLVSPFLNGFLYGFESTGDTAWLDRLIDWADALVARSVREPDGHVGWPKAHGASTHAVPGFVTDNMLGEAMAMVPLVRMTDPALRARLPDRHAERAAGYLTLAESLFQKWDARGGWRALPDGGVWVVPPFGLDPASGGWTDGYARRWNDGFTMPANKLNLIATWLLAMHRATGHNVYLERAGAWFRTMRGRIREMQAEGGSTRWEWNYWDPAAPWDFRPDGAAKHWVGVHPNGGYYAIDAQAMVAACEHGAGFSEADVDRLTATNLGFMWDGRVEGARFRRIDGGPADPRWAATPGCLWSALAPYHGTVRRIFEANHRPDSWGGISTTPWYVALWRREGWAD